MSDGPTKIVPEAEPLDEIILGDDDTVAEPPPVRPKSSPPPPARASARPIDRNSAPAAAPSGPPAPLDRDRDRTGSDRMRAVEDGRDSPSRKLPKMTLRIPDDEISRPTGGSPSGAMPAAAVQGSADDTLELPTDQVRARASALANEPAAKAGPAVGIDATHERGWTPFQPQVDDRPAMGPIKPTPIVALGAEAKAPAQNGGSSGREARDTYEDAPAPISEEIPVELSDVPETSSDEIATHPRLPATLDSEEIKIEDGDRSSETGEFEIAVEDLVSVESMPGAHVPPPIKAAVTKTADNPGPTATALMAGVAPPAAPSKPAVAAATPSSPALHGLGGQHPLPPANAAPAYATPPPHPPPRPSDPSLGALGSLPPPAALPPLAPLRPTPPHEHAPAPSSPDLRKQNDPLLFVPPVGGLAPPPMTDTAAHRKKTRPWWEELFNDDFIRTMAKVTDAQITKEVVFIEESLGCEAGATILDLACGTGRHAVELAARGYQVVGFDLSLAMLARASDEAQDRKQKINFVQGDMREMTFEETFDGVYAWNTSFGYFDEEKNGAVIARVHKALKKGGQFLLDVVNRDYIVRQAPSLAWFEGDGCICMDEMGIDFITSRMKVKRTLMMDDGRTKEIEYSVRIYSLHELGKMLHDNGFRVAEVSGRTGTPGVFFGCESPRTLILAEKR
jgi:SAM-dependent methyltransferase